MAVPSLFPNPSFEEFSAQQQGCTSGQVNGLPDGPGQIDCAVGWRRASNATTDFWNAFTFSGAGPELPPALPQPLPAGTGVAGFWAEVSEAYREDGSEDGTGEQLAGYKEYLGACLLDGGALATDREYRMAMQVGFMQKVSATLQGDYAATRIKSPAPAVLALYGVRACDSLYFENTDCPERSEAPGWELITNFLVNGIGGSWSATTVDFTPAYPYEAIAVGPACASQKESGSWRHYYFVDELRINERAAFDQAISGPIRVTGNSVCDENILLEGDTRPGATYQWYKNGVAINGATSPAHRPPPGLDIDGNYQLRTSSPAGCAVSDNVIIQRPILPAAFVSDSVSFCGDNSFRLYPSTDFFARYQWSDLTRHNNFLVTEAGDYSVTISTPCERVVETFHVTESGEQSFRAIPSPAAGCRGDTVRVRLTSNWFYPRFELTDQYGFALRAGAVVTKDSLILYPPLPPEVHIIGYPGNCSPDTVKLYFPLSGELSVAADILPIGCLPEAGSISLTTDATAVYQWAGPGLTPGTNGNVLNTTAAGAYAVTISDGTHCPFTAEYDLPFSGGFLAEPALTPDPCTNVHDVTLKPTGGLAPYTVDWYTRSNGQFATDQTTISDLPSGEYYAEVTEDSGCRRRLSFAVPELPVFRFTDIETRTDCRGQGGAISAQVENGLPPYRYFLEDGSGQPERTFAGLAAGIYLVGASDANGCRIYGPPTPLWPPPDFTVDVGPDLLTSPGEPNPLSHQLTPSDQPVESYAWRPYPGLECWDCPQAIAAINETTTYHLTITSPDGCTRTDSLTIKVDNLPRYYVPTAFSPNGDGINDDLQVYLGPGSEQVEKLEIYDRWGQLVWIHGPDGDRWDGRISGRKAVPGVYSYTGAIKLRNGKIVDLRGAINLLR